MWATMVRSAQFIVRVIRSKNLSNPDEHSANSENRGNLHIYVVAAKCIKNIYSAGKKSS